MLIFLEGGFRAAQDLSWSSLMQIMKYVLDHTGKPYAKLFEDISAIPRGSFKEEKIADFVCSFAADLGLEYHRDEANNIVVRKPASPGFEDHEVVMLQGHMDMIWNKRPGSTFDFEHEGIQLVVRDGFLMAEETTCGSDDGVAVAYMLAVLQDRTLKHPPLECVFTTAEEPGLYGVEHFDCSQLKARKYINMDGNLEGTSLLVAAGAANGRFTKSFRREEAGAYTELTIHVHGLTGAHVQYQERQLANAIKVAARILYYIQKAVPYRLISIDGGSITTIPTSCTAKIALAGADLKAAKKIAEKIFQEVTFEHKESDPGMRLDLSSCQSTASVVPEDAGNAIVSLLYMLPFGLVDTSLVFPNLPISSYSLETIDTSETAITWFYRPTSAITSKLLDMDEHTRILAELYGVDYQVENYFYGHCVEGGSPLYQVYDEVWFEQNGEHIRPIGAHYGNEIGFFLRNMPWLDMILLVPTHYQAHTPDEKLDLASFDRCYRCLVEILARI